MIEILISQILQYEAFISLQPIKSGDNISDHLIYKDNNNFLFFESV